MSATPRARRALTAALIAGGALLLHQLRYVLVYGAGAEDALALHGHAYLVLVTPLVAAALALSVRPLLGLAPAAAPPPRAPGLRRVWLGASGALLVTYAMQEWLEGVIVHGHPEGVAAITGHGGWTALFLAVVVGGLVALALRAVELSRPAAGLSEIPRVASTGPVVATAAAPRRPRPNVMACSLAGRAPPS